jgi:hypothetical protein
MKKEFIGEKYICYFLLYIHIKKEVNLPHLYKKFTV